MELWPKSTKVVKNWFLKSGMLARKSGVEGEIRTRESLWDNRLAVYRLARLGYLHLFGVYVVTVLNFWILGRRCTEVHIPPDLLLIIRKCSNCVFWQHEWVAFYMNSWLYDSPWCVRVWRRQNRYILHSITRVASEKRDVFSRLFLLANHGESRSPHFSWSLELWRSMLRMFC